MLDPNILTLGFARRFTDYKRPDLLLHDRARLARLLCDETRPVQLVLAGKAHPDDEAGKRMIQEWVTFCQDPRYRRHAVFLEDYDISLAQQLVQGVDVWVNTPRRPWEACGTSGMKVLVNGGLNLSTLDGWWEEAYAPDLGWAIGDVREDDDAAQDRRDADELYALLERDIIPAFYDRDASGVPQAWVTRMKRSMAALTTRYSATRMVREYLGKAWSPATRAIRARLADGALKAKAMAAWDLHSHRAWAGIHIGELSFTPSADGWSLSVPVYLPGIGADDVRVEVYANASRDGGDEVVPLSHDGLVPGTTGGYFYYGGLAAGRHPEDYTVRVVPAHPGVLVPAEIALIRWQR